MAEQVTQEQIAAYAETWADALCECAGEDKTFAEQFKKDLFSSKGVYSAYIYYMFYQKFSCAYAIQGVTLADIMIVQIEHFRANLDKGEYEMRENGDKMLLMAFRTMLDMEKDPNPFLERMGKETGTDYPNKY